MGKTHSFDFRKGSLICPISGVAGTLTTGEFTRSEKGLAYSNEGISVGIGVTLDSSVTIDKTSSTLVIWFKTDVNNDSSGFLLSSNIADSYSYLGFRGTTLLRLESDTNGEFWVDEQFSPYGNKWVALVITASSGNINTYLNCVLFDSSTSKADDLTFRYIGGSSSYKLKGNIAKVEVFDHVLTQNEIAKDYSEFLNSHPITKAVNENLDYNAVKPTTLTKLDDSVIGKPKANLTNLTVNAGAVGQTDWVDSNSDGIADNWSSFGGNFDSGSIVTGNGFTGNAQRVVALGVNGAIQSSDVTLVSGVRYKVKMKIRSNISSVRLYTAGSGELIDTLNLNVDYNATTATYSHSIYTAKTGGTFRIYASAAGWFEVDEVSVAEWDGDEVLNGDFDDENYWNWIHAGISITDGVCRFEDAANGVYIRESGVISELGQYYQVTFKVLNYVKGGLQSKCGSVDGTAISADGVYTEIVQGLTSSYFYFYTVGVTTLDVEFVSVKKVSGLIAAYNLIHNDSALVDISGGGNDGAISGAMSSVNGLVFNGSSDYVDFGKPTILSGLIAATWVLRFKSEDSAASKYLFAQTYNGTAFAILLNSSKLSARSTGSGNITSTDDFDDGLWHNVVLVLDKATLLLYADGILIGSVTDADALSITTDDHLVIGARGDDGAISGYCDCEIADAKIYDYAFSEQEAIDYHNQFAKEVNINEPFSDFGVGANI